MINYRIKHKIWFLVFMKNMINNDESTKLADKSTKMRQQRVFFGATNDQTGHKKRYRGSHGFHPRALRPCNRSNGLSQPFTAQKPKMLGDVTISTSPITIIHHHSSSLTGWWFGTMEFGLTFHWEWHHHPN